MNYQNYNKIIKYILNNDYITKTKSTYFNYDYYSNIIHKKYIDFTKLDKGYRKVNLDEIHNYVGCYAEYQNDYIIIQNNYRPNLLRITNDPNNFELNLTVKGWRYHRKNSFYTIRYYYGLLIICSSYKRHYFDYDDYNELSEFLNLDIKHLSILNFNEIICRLKLKNVISFHSNCKEIGYKVFDDMTNLRYIILPKCKHMNGVQHYVKLLYAPNLFHININIQRTYIKCLFNTIYAPYLFNYDSDKYDIKDVCINLIKYCSMINLFGSKCDYNWIIENSYMLQELKNDAKEDENVDEELKEVIKDVDKCFMFNLLNKDYENVLVCILVEYLEQDKKIEEMNKLINVLIHLQINVVIYPVILISRKAFKTID